MLNSNAPLEVNAHKALVVAIVVVLDVHEYHLRLIPDILCTRHAFVSARPGCIVSQSWAACERKVITMM